MIVLMQCHELIGAANQPDAGKWLRAYDLDTGEVLWTADRDQAQVFASIGDALDLWGAKTKLPARPDGKPNRPLTAHTVSLDVQAAEIKQVNQLLADKKQVT